MLLTTDLLSLTGQLNQIKKHGLLAKILCNNYDINEIQPNVFKVPDNRSVSLLFVLVARWLKHWPAK